MDGPSNISIQDRRHDTDLDNEKLILDHKHSIRVGQKKQSLMDIIGHVSPALENKEYQMMYSPNHKRKLVEFRDSQDIVEKCSARAIQGLNLMSDTHQLCSKTKSVASPSLPCTPMQEKRKISLYSDECNIDSPLSKSGGQSTDDLSLRDELPKKRQRYRRRNSILVRRNNEIGSTALTEKCLAAIRRLKEQETREQKSPHNRKEEPASENIGHSTKNKKDQEVTLDWGNASWANTDDTQWYNRLSSISFDESSAQPQK